MQQELDPVSGFLSKVWEVSPIAAILLAFGVIAVLLKKYGYIGDKDPVVDRWRDNITDRVSRLEDDNAKHKIDIAVLKDRGDR